MRLLITGATGFVGHAVAARCARDSSYVVRAAARRQIDNAPPGVEQVLAGDIDGSIDWSAALRDVDAVVHAAARVHVMHESAADPLAAFRRANVEGTVNLARQAAAAGVRRFVFVSSVKVNGEETVLGHPFTSSDMPAPVDPYGVSKHEAEEELRQLAAQTGMEVAIIRPVLAYGPGVKGNFHSLMRWLAAGIPLPLGAIDNRRSLVALPNLVDLIVTCIWHQRAANQTFLVSDGDDLSTTMLLRRTAHALGVRARLLQVPAPVLTATARLLGRSAWAKRLCGSLQVDIQSTRELLDWTPPINVDEALRMTAQDFLSRKDSHRRAPLDREQQASKK